MIFICIEIQNGFWFRLIFLIRTSGNLFVCVLNDQIYRITNVLAFIRLSVINSYAREFAMYTNTECLSEQKIS